MSGISIILLVFAMLNNDFGHCFTTQDVEIVTPAYETDPEFEEQHSSLLSANMMNKAIENIEQLLSSADKSYREGILPIEEIDKMYDAMNVYFVDIIKMLENPNNAYEFLKVKGLDRVIITNLAIPYNPLRNTILTLLRHLFDLAPSTTNAVMPARMIDKILDIFFDNDDKVLKLSAVGILHVWLPENPRVQARVMKVKGLVPFYEQMNQLDVQSLHTLLDLFNKILQEHLDVRYKNPQESKRDADELKLYQRIGLIEHMSRKDVCNGILGIFENTWNSWSPENLTPLLLDLSTKIGPLCLKNFKGNPKVEDLYVAFLEYLQEQNREEYLAKSGMNASTIKTFLTSYIDSLQQMNEIKDEF